MNLPRFWTIGIVVLILAAVVNLGAMNAAERGFVELRNTADWVQHTQRVQNLIEHLLRLAVDAETGQRGYLLSGRDSQLERYVEARNEIPVSLDELRTLTTDNPVQVAQLVNVGTQLAARLDILERGIALKRGHDDAGLTDYLADREGKIAMDALRLALDGMATEERKMHEERFAGFERSLVVIRWGFFLVFGLNLILVTLGGVMLGLDSRRRRGEAVAATDRGDRLAQEVLERTAEITALSHYLQRLQEDEKARLAREIHDELGGTLAAAKIDLQMLANKLPPEDLQRTRLLRAMAAIDDAVQVKRRIIEDLRPSVLDNLGIGAALKWQCLEFQKRLGVPCRVELHDDDLVLPSAPSIALYRVTQEALTNIGKYASAKNVTVSLRRDDGHWVLRVADDGIGLDPAKAEHPTGFGLLAMRERVRALGGDFSVSGRPGEGTVIQVRLPAGIAAAA
jgi:signal transduction histidine kinase